MSWFAVEMYAQDSKTRKSKTNVCAHIFVILDEKQYGKEVQNTMKSNKEKRQKSLRRVGSFLLAAMLMFSSTATAFAFDKDTVLQESTKIFTKQTTKQLADEGMVLLENEQKDAETGEGNGVPVLPLSKGSVVSVFGVGQNKWSTGSFYDGLDENFIDIMEGLEASEDLEINEDLRNWYNDVTKDEAIPEEILQQAVEHSDVALIVFYRKNGEGSEGKATQGGYYLTDDELAMVDSVNQTFDKTIVVFNTGYTVDMQWVKDKHIDASIWAGLPGNEGGNALADILTGAVNPSGNWWILMPKVGRIIRPLPIGRTPMVRTRKGILLSTIQTIFMWGTAILRRLMYRLHMNSAMACLIRILPGVITSSLATAAEQ